MPRLRFVTMPLMRIRACDMRARYAYAVALLYYGVAPIYVVVDKARAMLLLLIRAASYAALIQRAMMSVVTRYAYFAVAIYVATIRFNIRGRAANTFCR